MKKILYILLTISTFIICEKNIYAKEIEYQIDRNYKSIVYDHDEYNRYLQILKVDDNQAFSLNAELEFDGDSLNIDDEYLKNIDEDKFELIRRIYINSKKENTIKAYMAAQEIIWEILNGYQIYWVDKFDNQVNLSSEKNTILNNPIIDTNLDFDNNISANYFEKIKLENNFLKDFELVNESRNLINKTDSYLEITVKEDAKISLVKNVKDLKPVVYYDDNQPHIISYTDDLLTNDYNIKVKNVKNAYMELQFTYNNMPINGKVTFKLDNKILETNSLGYFLSNNTYNLETKSIEILEVPNSYQLQNKIIEIKLVEDEVTNDQKVIFKQELEPKKGNIKITTIGISNDQSNYLKDIKYELYAKEDIILDGIVIYKKGAKINEYTTNENGILEINNLYLGSYILKNIHDDTYIDLDDIEFNLTEEDSNFIYNAKKYHIPLKIELDNSDYYLIDKNGNEQKLDEKNELNIDYGNYTIIQKEEEKITNKINIKFDKDSAIYKIKLEDEIIMFDMPKTKKDIIQKNKYEFK